MKTPRAGSVANACTEVRTPERTRNVPSREREKARTGGDTAPLWEAPRFSGARREWVGARPKNPGKKGGFRARTQNPPPAPAELVVRPAAAERDAYGEKCPCRGRPWARPARPSRVEPA